MSRVDDWASSKLSRTNICVQYEGLCPLTEASRSLFSAALLCVKTPRVLVFTYRPEVTHGLIHTEESAFAHIEIPKREKWFSPGVDRISSTLPREFICCLKHNTETEGVSPCSEILHSCTHTGETEPLFSTLFLSPGSTPHLLISPPLSLFHPLSLLRSLKLADTHTLL